MNHHFTRAILTVSFGTSVQETRTKTLEAIEYAICSEFSDYAHERAWTSKQLRAKVMETEGVKIHSVQEALTQLKSAGVLKVYIQPTFVTNGGEYQKLIQEAAAFQSQFQALHIGSPLLENTEDFAPIIKAVTRSSAYQCPQADELLLFIGHGTTDGEDSLYEQLDQTFQSSASSNIRLKTMRSATSVDEIISAAHDRRAAKITLAPFMIAAGRHALKDISGDDSDSWKSRLEQAGFQVRCERKGLGEIPEIQQLFLHKLQKLFHR